MLGAGFFVERLSNQYSLLKTDKEQTATYANLLPFGVPPLNGLWRGPDSNRRPLGYEPSYLPTDIPHNVLTNIRRESKSSSI